MPYSKPSPERVREIGAHRLPGRFTGFLQGIENFTGLMLLQVPVNRFVVFPDGISQLRQ
jgi:hypothetical protein